METMTSDSIDLINKVDAFYNSAWDKLIIVGVAAFTIVGIVVPLIIQWYQKKSLKLSEELLKKTIELEANKIKEDILNTLNEKLQEHLKVYEKKIEELGHSANAKTFHLQGSNNYDKNHIKQALGDFIVAGHYYMLSDDYTNLQAVLKIINDNCISRITIEEIEDLKITHDSDLTKFLDDVSDNDEKGALSFYIREIRLKISKLPKTINDSRLFQPK